MPATPVKIKVMANGSLVLDGAPTTLQQLKDRISQCDPANNVVWYYRENSDAPEPPPVALDVLNVVMKQRIPISLSSKPDFSDVIDNAGVSHPRK